MVLVLVSFHVRDLQTGFEDGCLDCHYFFPDSKRDAGHTEPVKVASLPDAAFPAADSCLLVRWFNASG